MKKILLFLIATLLLSFICLVTFGQTTRYERLSNPVIAPGIKVTTSAAIAANSSALFDVQSTTKGAKFPVMTAAQRLAIASPVAGLMVFDSDSDTYCAYDGAGWKCFGVSNFGGNVTAPTQFSDKVTFLDSLFLTDPPEIESFGKVLVIDSNGQVGTDSIFCHNIIPCDSGTTNIGSDDNHFHNIYADTIIVGGNVILGSGALPNIASGVYLPDTSDGINVTAFTSDTAQYMRVGNVVTVSGQVTVTTSATGSFELSLPISSTLTRSSQLAGAGATVAALVGAISIEGNTTSGNAVFRVTGSLTDIPISYTYTYLLR